MASTWSSVVVCLHQPGHNSPIYLIAQNFKMGSVLHTLVFHTLLWNALLLKNAAYASATDAAIYQHTWLPENCTYTNVGVFVDVTTLVQCAVFSQHNAEEHNAFNFQRGKCELYMLPPCCDLNIASALHQNSEIGVRVFRRIENSFYNRQTAPVNPPRINLALGEFI